MNRYNPSGNTGCRDTGEARAEEKEHVIRLTMYGLLFYPISSVSLMIIGPLLRCFDWHNNCISVWELEPGRPRYSAARVMRHSLLVSSLFRLPPRMFDTSYNTQEARNCSHVMSNLTQVCNPIDMAI